MQPDTVPNAPHVRPSAEVRGQCLWLGRFGVGLFLCHVAYCALTEHVAEAFWVCHVAFLVLSLGMWLGWARWVSVGALCLLAGTPAWLVNVAAGLPMGITSACTHLGGFAYAVVGLRRLGIARHSWIAATLFVGLVQCVCRLATPAALNINAAFEVYGPLQPYFASHLRYEIALGVIAATLFFGLETVLRACVGVAPSEPLR